MLPLPTRHPWIAGAALLSVLLAVPAAAQVSVDWVPIGHPSNAPDEGGVGSVAVRFRIARYETTKAQYAAFLNAVAADDTHGLYHPIAAVSGIDRFGAPGSYGYAVISGREEEPAVYVSFWSAARFANWMHNGQPSGAQDAGTTEDGAYTLTPAAIAANSVTRNPGALFFVPSQDEWYKAAYHDPTSGGYFDYPTGTDVQTTCIDVPWPEPNFANCDYPSESELPVGSYPASPSPYGTFDQGGNVFEWNEQVEMTDLRQLRGGGFGFFDASYLAASTSGAVLPDGQVGNVGFRLAATAPAPLPASAPAGIALLSALLALMGARAAGRDPARRAAPGPRAEPGRPETGAPPPGRCPMDGPPARRSR